ncbi:glutaredoxin [Scopulibacillus daqui]|uniref:Glutaredoxin n=1 Tax=Scopulibacillus daqui TaxID=1469162 RepID=A0ABS2Q3Y8_9BACL|nr:glutaredoxin family protein [Scopulibacillus daqui]MBM7647023.1 glutaredoxin [Scopulibacillus daqui]
MINNKEIIVYTQTGCPFCHQQVQWMKENKILFIEKNITNSEEFLNEFLDLHANGVPYTLIKNSDNEHKVIGFNKEKLEQLIMQS